MLSIEPLTPAHWPDVLAIYLEGIATGNATFQQSAPDWLEWNESHLQHSRLVAVSADKVLGWAALSPVSQRLVYAGVAEVSIYIAQSARGKGVGTELLAALIETSEAVGIWTLQAGIFPENHASVRLHKAAGFREVGTRTRIGSLRGIWRDVLLLERRSGTMGTFVA